MSSSSGSTGGSQPGRRRRRRKPSASRPTAAGTTSENPATGHAPPTPRSATPPRDTTPRDTTPQATPTGGADGAPTMDGTGTAPGASGRGRRRRGPRRGRGRTPRTTAATGTDADQAADAASGPPPDSQPRPAPRSGRSRRGRRAPGGAPAGQPANPAGTADHSRGGQPETTGQPRRGPTPADGRTAGSGRPASGRARAAAANSQSRRSGRRLRTVDETSAGGLVVNTKNSSAALIGRLDRRGRLLWSLPKGHLEDGETAEQAAIREVAEETGIDGRVLAPLGTIDYWFVAEDRRVHKTVHHFLMEAIGGELCDEDLEVTEVAWVPLAELDGRLAYADERRLVRLAAGLLSESA